MHWLALHWPAEAAAAAHTDSDAAERTEAAVCPQQQRLLRGWWALGFTTSVCWYGNYLLMEVGASERLWGGRQALLAAVQAGPAQPGPPLLAQGCTAGIALAHLMALRAGEAPPADPLRLALGCLPAALPHLRALECMGCRSWGDLARLPRAGVARRFGGGLVDALDEALGRKPMAWRWIEAPPRFDERFELHTPIREAPVMQWAVRRALEALQQWLRARQQGALAIEVGWRLDLRRHDGRELPPWQSLSVRTAQPVQEPDHLLRLVNERLAQVQLQAPAIAIRLQCLESEPWQAGTRSLLPPASTRTGVALHELVERLSARLGKERVLRPVLRDDHRPERMQHWVPAVDWCAPAPRERAPPGHALLPTWLLERPQRLAVQAGMPQYLGTLDHFAGPQRIEAGWWEADAAGSVRRDYFIARSPGAGLVWVFCELPQGGRARQAQPRWFLHGLYA